MVFTIPINEIGGAKGSICRQIPTTVVWLHFMSSRFLIRTLNLLASWTRLQDRRGPAIVERIESD